MLCLLCLEDMQRTQSHAHGRAYLGPGALQGCLLKFVCSFGKKAGGEEICKMLVTRFIATGTPGCGTSLFWHKGRSGLQKRGERCKGSTIFCAAQNTPEALSHKASAAITAHAHKMLSSRCIENTATAMYKQTMLKASAKGGPPTFW